jgi:hypothetical protein
VLRTRKDDRCHCEEGADPSRPERTAALCADRRISFGNGAPSRQTQRSRRDAAPIRAAIHPRCAADAKPRPRRSVPGRGSMVVLPASHASSNDQHAGRQDLSPAQPSRAMPGEGSARGEGDSSVAPTGRAAFPRARGGRFLGMTGVSSGLGRTSPAGTRFMRDRRIWVLGGRIFPPRTFPGDAREKAPCEGREILRSRQRAARRFRGPGAGASSD